MNFLLESILNPKNGQGDLSSTIIKIGQPFSLVDQMGPMGSDAWRNSWENYRAGIVTPTDASFLWKNIDAVIDDIGNNVYEKISRYIDNISNIDLCGLKALYSICQYTDYSDKISVLQFDYPGEIRELLDILSINKNLLLSTDKVLTEECRNNILNSLVSAAPSLSSDDPRESWTSDEPLIYFSINNSSGVNGTYYRDTSETDKVVFYNPNSDIKIALTTLSGDVITDIAVAYNFTTKKILAASYDIENIQMMISADTISEDAAIEFFDGASFSVNSPGILTPGIDSSVFIPAPKDYNLAFFDSLFNLALDSPIRNYGFVGSKIKYLALDTYDEKLTTIIVPKFVIARDPGVGVDTVPQYRIYQTKTFNRRNFSELGWLEFPYPLYHSAATKSDPEVSLNNTVFIPYSVGGFNTTDVDLMHNILVIGMLQKNADSLSSTVPVVGSIVNKQLFVPAYIPSTITISDSRTNNVDGTYQLKTYTENGNGSYDITWEANHNSNLQLTRTDVYTASGTDTISANATIIFPTLLAKDSGPIEIDPNGFSIFSGIRQYSLDANSEIQLSSITDEVRSTFVSGNLLQNEVYCDLISQCLTTGTNDTDETLSVYLRYIKDSATANTGKYRLDVFRTNKTPVYWQTDDSYIFGGAIPDFNASAVGLNATIWNSPGYDDSAPDQSAYALTKALFRKAQIIQIPLSYKWEFALSTPISSNSTTIQRIGLNTLYELLDQLHMVTVPEQLNVNGYPAGAQTKFTTGAQFTDPDITYSAGISQWSPDLYTINRRTLTTDEYKAYITNIFEKVLTAICTMPYADDPDLPIYQAKFNEFNGESLFLTELKYTSEAEKQTIVNAKLRNNVKLTFNEQEAYENIVLGKTRIEDYTPGERIIIAYEKTRQNAARIEGVNLSRYYRARELKVKEYFKFLLTFNSYISQSISNFDLYNIDNNYFNITDLSGISDTVYDLAAMEIADDNQPILDTTRIKHMAKSLADICIDIAHLRDQLKTRVTKLYMVGTWNLVRNYIVEYLFNTIYPAIGLSKDFNNTNFEVNLIEYNDGTEYFNIQTNETSSYTPDQRGRLNSKYWESEDNRYATADNLSDSDISAFYYDTLGLRLVDDNGNPVKTNDALIKFLNTIYEAGAVTNTTADYHNADNLQTKEDLAKYSGDGYGKYPYYNFKNMAHPSYQLHQYIYNFTKYVYNKFSISNLFLTAEAEYSTEIQNHISSYIDNYGNVINKWLAGRYDFTGYNTAYENDPEDNKYVRIDGPFNMYALNEYLSPAYSEAEDAFNAVWDKYYLPAEVEPADKEAISAIFCNTDIRNKIRTLSDQLIYRYSVDAYNSSITLYKSNDDKDEQGELWFRPLKHALSLPMFIFDEISALGTTSYELLPNNYIGEYVNQETDFIDEIAKTFEPNAGMQVLKVYDFDINLDQNYIAFIAKRPDPSTGSEVALSSEISAFANINELSSWNYANSFVSFCKLDQVYDNTAFRYKYYLRSDTENLQERSQSSGPISTTSNMSRALAGVHMGDDGVYCIYYSYPFKLAASNTDQVLGLPATTSINGNTYYPTTLLVEKYQYGTGDNNIKNIAVNLAYPISTEKYSTQYPYLKLPKTFLNHSDGMFSLTFECPQTDTDNVFFMNTTAVSATENVKNTDALAGTIKGLDLNDPAGTFNIALLDKAFVSIDFSDVITDSRYTSNYFNRQTDNQYTPVYPAQLGITNVWQSSFADEPSAKFQVIVNPIELDISPFGYEQAVTTRSGIGALGNEDFYHLSAFHAVELSNDNVTNWEAYTSYTTITLTDGSLSADYYPLIAHEYQIDELTGDVLLSGFYEGIASDKEANAIELIEAYNNPFSFKLTHNKNNAGKELSSYTWLAPEHQHLEFEDINSFIPRAYELSVYNLEVERGESNRFRNYAIISLQENMNMGVTYYLGNNEIDPEDNKYQPIDLRTNVRLYDRNNPESEIRFDLTNAKLDPAHIDSSPQSPYTQQITLISAVDTSVSATYEITLDEFDSTNLYKIKFTAVKLD